MRSGEEAATETPGDRLHDEVRCIGAPFGRERSIKLRDQRVLANRFLLTVAREDIGIDASQRVLDVCRRIEMPEPFRQAMAKHITPADMIHFGYEEEQEGRAFFKVYLERGDQLARAMESHPPVTEPFVLFNAFKWNCADPHEHAVTRYVCHPRLSRTAMLQRVAAVYAGQAGRTPWEMVCEIISAATRRVPESDLLYLDVTEDGTTRKSFDVNLYRAGLRVESVVPYLERLAAHFRLGADLLREAFAGADELRLGHIAGGVDRQGRDFLTIYFGAAAGV